MGARLIGKFVLWTWVAITPTNPTIVTVPYYDTLQQCYDSGQTLDDVWFTMGVQHHHACTEIK